MSQKLKLVREEKLFRLLPGREESSRLEASGIALIDEARQPARCAKKDQSIHIFRIPADRNS